MATIISATGAAGSWTIGSTWIGGVAPTAADDVQIPAATTSITINSGAVARSVDFTGFTGTVTHSAASTLTIGDGTAGLGNVALTLVAGMTYTLGDAATSAITFVSTSATQQTIATGGKTTGTITINGAGSSYILSDNLTTSGNFTYTAGTTFDTTTGSRVITLNGVSRTFAGANKTYYELDTTGSGTTTITGANTFTNLNRTGTAAKTDVLSLAGNQTVTGVLTLAGNSSINRILVTSNTIGTARTITNTGATMTWSNVDFRDITLGTAFNASAITGLSGDAGGNSGITFTTSASQTWSGTLGGNWSANAWTSRVPLPQDDVVINSAFSASQTITQDMPRAGRSIDFTGATGTPTFTTNLAASVFGSLTLISGMTLTASTQTYTFEGRSTYTLTNAGNTWAKSISFNAPGGTLTLQDAFTTSQTLFINNGTFDANNFNVTATAFTSSVNTVRTITMGSGTWTLTSTGAINVWDTGTSTNLTLNANTSTIKISGSTTNIRTFAGGSKTFYNLWFTNATTGGGLTISGTNTFNDFRIDAADATAQTITFPNVTTTVTTFSVSGSALKLITLQRKGAAGTFTLSDASGNNCSDYLSISNSTATGGAGWYAGTNSTNGGGNTGWDFVSTCPAAGQTFSGLDTISFTDSFTLIRGILTSLLTSINLSDNVSLVKTHIVALLETLNLADIQSSNRNLISSLQETITINDNISAIKGLLTEISDSVNLSETTSLKLTYLSNLIDNIILTETLSAISSGATVGNSRRWVLMRM